jgi:multimeric flavodoxin WrbA
MNICIVSGTPKKDGLCHNIIQTAMSAAKNADASVKEVRLCDYDLLRCQVCDDGWGICRTKKICKYGDDGFEEIRGIIKASDAVVLVSPVYWGETTEVFKAFIDRFRRCEFGADNSIRGKQTLIIAVPGGSGNGLLSCFEQMDRFCRHTGAVIFDYIGINRWNNDYKRKAVFAAVQAIASGRVNGDTIPL